MQYLCLFYGSDNSQYRNYCINKEDPNPPLQADKKFAPKAPCRSFCVQVAFLFQKHILLGCVNPYILLHPTGRNGVCE